MRLPHSRRGNVLTWFAVLLFVLLPLAALVIDFGFVLLTRRQMQTAVNSAASEGLRFRDEIPVHVLEQLVETVTGAPCTGDVDCYAALDGVPECNCGGAEESVKRDYLRRVAARQLVQAIYDEDLNATIGSAGNSGAGPTIDFEGGLPLDETDFRAGRLITADGIGAYRPELELNRADAAHGDLVAGRILSTGVHLENDLYLRTDFAANQSPKDGLLVRLRRTQSEFAGTPLLDNLDGVSSSGPTVPFLFGRGANTRAISGNDPAAVWTQRERGSVVRATAIARAAPAVQVGVPHSLHTYSGVSHLRIDGDVGRIGAGAGWWEQAATGPVVVDTSDPGSLRALVDVDGDAVPELVVVGRFVTTFATRQIPEQVGRVVGPSVGLTDLELGSERFVPVFRMIGAFPRIIGFSRIRFESESILRKLPSQVAALNASTHWAPSPPQLTPLEWSALRGFAADFARNPSNSHVLASALTRAVD